MARAKFTCDELEDAVLSAGVLTHRALARTLSLRKKEDIHPQSVGTALKKRCKHLESLFLEKERKQQQVPFAVPRSYGDPEQLKSYRERKKFGLDQLPAVRQQEVPWLLRGERGSWLVFGLPVLGVLAFLATQNEA